MVVMHWPWHNQEHKDRNVVSTTAEDTKALRIDIAQIKHINDYLLQKALANHWITVETAEALRTTQPTVEDGSADDR